MSLRLLRTLLLIAASGCAGNKVQPAEPAPAPISPAPSPPAASAAPPAVAAPAPVAQAEVDITASRPVLAADKEEEIFVRIRVRGLPMSETSRPPINLALVVDASGSMDGEGIVQARDACAAVVDAMNDGDALSIVTFGSRPNVVVSAKRIDTRSRAAAKQAIKGIVADGTTDMAGGIKVGLEQLRAHMKADGINRIVLVGDGVPNDPSAATAFADQAKAQRVPITSLGLGPEFDETLMASIAQRTGGTFHFIEDATMVSQVFQDQIGKMNRLVARNARVDVTAGPGVTILETFGLPGVAGRTARLPIGDLTEGQVRDTILRVRLKGHRDGLKVELFDAVVHHQPPAGGAEVSTSRFAALRASSNPDAWKEANKEVEHEASKLRVADGIVRAIAMARGGDLQGARKLLDVTGKFAREGAKRFEDVELKGRVDEIAKLKKTIHTLVPGPELGTIGRSPGTGLASPPRASKSMDVSPAAALGIRSAHGSAMRDLQQQ